MEISLSFVRWCSFFTPLRFSEYTINFYLWFSIRRSSTINKLYNLFWKLFQIGYRNVKIPTASNECVCVRVVKEHQKI